MKFSLVGQLLLFRAKHDIILWLMLQWSRQKICIDRQQIRIGVRWYGFDLFSRFL